MEMAFWTEQRAALREHLATGDRATFLRWPLIVSTMFYPLVPAELDYLKNHPEWTFIRSLLKDPGVGGAEPVDASLGTNGNIVHHVYHIFRFEAALGRRLSGEGSILEVGGGYGNFCRLAFRRGFAGTYRIFDLPEFLELQRWYLGRTLPGGDVGFLTALPDEPVDVLVGLWSISELPFALRDRIKALRPKYFLVAYQREFYGLDNVGYFARWMADDAYAWHDIEIPHIAGDRYLFGARK
jgi:hypothetical protein